MTTEATPTLRERSDVALRCLPDSPYRAMLAALFDEMLAEVERLADQAADYKARKDAAYEERNKVVAALAKVFPSGIAKTAIEGWSEDWHGCVYIDLPTGQVSWHFHDSQAALFDGLPPYPGKWDGHDTPEKYRRLAALAAQAAPTYSGWVWKHIKSGGEYELLGNAKVQCDEPLTDMAEVYVYQGEDGRMWARPLVEFNARFKRSRPHGRPIAAQPSQAPVVQAVQAASEPSKWIDDPHDIEGGQMINPAWLKANGFSSLRAYVDADRASSGATTAQAVRMLTPAEIKALTAMVWGAPCAGRDLAIVTSTVRAMEALGPGERPIDPADGGRLLDVDACIVEPAAALATEGQTP